MLFRFAVFTVYPAYHPSSRYHSPRDASKPCPSNRSSLKLKAPKGNRITRSVSRTEPARVSRPTAPVRDNRSSYDDRISLPIKSDVAYIEIEPGFEAPLRRAEETVQAICRNEFVSSTCYGCEASIYCIDDAKFLICPHCKVVSPLLLSHPNQYAYGVGLGFTHQTLVETRSASRRSSASTLFAKSA